MPGITFLFSGHHRSRFGLWLYLNQFLKDAVLFLWRHERVLSASDPSVQVRPLWLLEYAIWLKERENDNSQQLT